MDTHDHLPFFFYGSLKAGESNARLVDRFPVERRPARLNEVDMFESDDLGYPFAVRGKGSIQGEIVTVTQDRYHELLADMDRLEGHTGDPQTSLFIREMVVLDSGASAWAYFSPLLFDSVPVAARRPVEIWTGRRI